MEFFFLGVLFDVQKLRILILKYISVIVAQQAPTARAGYCVWCKQVVSLHQETTWITVIIYEYDYTADKVIN